MGSPARSSSLQTDQYDEIRGHRSSLPWQLRLMPRLTPTMATTDILLPTGFLMPMATTPTHSDTTTARGPLMPSPPPMLMLMPTLATMATVMDTLMPMATPMPLDTTSARGLLMLSLPLMLMLILATTVMATASPTPMATLTPSDTTTARGLLTLSLLLTLMLTPTLATTATPLSLPLLCPPCTEVLFMDSATEATT